MNIELKEISQCKREVTVTFPSDLVNAEYEKSLKKYSKMVNIKGFRKGKAPLAMVREKYGDSIAMQFKEDFASDQYKDVVDELEIKPLTPGNIVDISGDVDNGLVVKYAYEVAPKIEKVDYEGVEMVFEEKKAGVAEVNTELENLRYKLAQSIDIDADPKKGDTIYADMKFVESGKEFKRNFIYGSTPYGEKFEADLKGVKVGDELASEMDYSKEKDGSDMKAVELKITAIKRLELPKIDDEFAKDAGFEDLKSMKADIKDDLKARMDVENMAMKRQAMGVALAKANEMEVPQEMVNQYAQQMAQPYAKAYKSQLGSLMPMFVGMAEAQLKEMYVMDFFRENLGVKLTDAEKEKFVSFNAGGMKMDLAEYKEKYKDSIVDEEKYFAPALDNKIVEKISKKMNIVTPQDKQKEAEASEKETKKEDK